jgi:hypothetical protein
MGTVLVFLGFPINTAGFARLEIYYDIASCAGVGKYRGPGIGILWLMTDDGDPIVIAICLVVVLRLLFGFFIWPSVPIVWPTSSLLKHPVTVSFASQRRARSR